MGGKVSNTSAFARAIEGSSAYWEEEGCDSAGHLVDGTNRAKV